MSALWNVQEPYSGLTVVMRVIRPMRLTFPATYLYVNVLFQMIVEVWTLTCNSRFIDRILCRVGLLSYLRYGIQLRGYRLLVFGVPERRPRYARVGQYRRLRTWDGRRKLTPRGLGRLRVGDLALLLLEPQRVSNNLAAVTQPLP